MKITPVKAKLEMPRMRANAICVLLIGLVAACSDPASRSTAQTTTGTTLEGPPLPAPARHAPADAASVKLSFAPVVRRVAPAVVNISSKRVVRQQADPFWEMFGAGAPRERIEGSLGSGVIVRADGIIVTNNHVIEGGQEITVSLADRREFPAKVLLADPRADLAVLKIDARDLPVLPIDRGEDQQVGDLVLAIGDPFGIGQTVTNGSISALNRSDVGSGTVSSYIQTDAAINPGNSGGALVDMDGDLIGVNSFIVSRSGSSSGVGFAIPGPVVRQVVEAALGGGRAVVRPWLGVLGQPVTGEMAAALGLDRPRGLLVGDVYPGSAGARAGLRQGDAVLTIDGQPVNDETSLSYRIGTHRVGDSVTLEYQRGGQTRTAKVSVDPPAALPARDEQTLQGRHPLDGATVLNLSPAVAIELGGNPFAKGVLVTQVHGGLSANAGFRPGDLIREINGRTVDSVAQLRSALAQGGRQWRITVDRNGQQIEAAFNL
ncbi:MAG: protease Do [Caulobacteraceae bacterium]|nr:protease Do [Caulobacteraceae bacterium]